MCRESQRHRIAYHWILMPCNLMKIRCISLIFLGILALGCSGPEEDITPLDYYEEDVDIQDIRVEVAIVPRRAGSPNIRITVGGAFDLNCPSSFEVYTKYRLEESHLFIRLFVGSGDETCFNDPNPRLGNISGVLDLNLQRGIHCFSRGKTRQ